jgi:hypothetical protein
LAATTIKTAALCPPACPSSITPQIRLDAQGRRLGGRDGEYNTPQSQKLITDVHGAAMQVDLGAAMTQMSDMDAEMTAGEGCRYVRVGWKQYWQQEQQQCWQQEQQYKRAGQTKQRTRLTGLTQHTSITSPHAGDACRVYGDVVVRRVAGKIHFAVHQQSFIDVLPQVRSELRAVTA